MIYYVIYYMLGWIFEVFVFGCLIICGIVVYVILGVGVEIRKKNGIYIYIIIKIKDMFVVKILKRFCRMMYILFNGWMYVYVLLVN